MSDEVRELGTTGFVVGVPWQVGEPCPARMFGGARCGAELVEKAMRARDRGTRGEHVFAQYVRCSRGHITFAE